MKKVFLLFFLLFMIAIPWDEARGQQLYYQGTYDHSSYSRFSTDYEHSHGGHLHRRHNFRFGYSNFTPAPGSSYPYYGNNNYIGCYRGHYYSRRHIVEKRYYGYPGYPYAPSPRGLFRPYYNTK